MIHRSTDIGAALRSRQRGFLLNPFRFKPAAPNPVTFSNVKLLLQLNGTDGSTTFTDSSASPKSPTVVAGNARIRTAQSKWGGAAAYFDGVGDYVTWADSADWDWGSGNGAVSFWIRREANGTQSSWRVFGNTNAGGGNSALFLSYSESTGAASAGWYNGSGYQAVSVGILPVNTWVYIAVSKSGTTMRGFNDGTLAGTVTITGSGVIFNPAEVFSIGRDGAGTYGHAYFPGYIDDFRWIKGETVYTTDFAVPTGPHPTS